MLTLSSSRPICNLCSHFSPLQQVWLRLTQNLVQNPYTYDMEATCLKTWRVKVGLGCAFQEPFVVNSTRSSSICIGASMQWHSRLVWISLSSKLIRVWKPLTRWNPGLHSMRKSFQPWNSCLNRTKCGSKGCDSWQRYSMPVSFSSWRVTKLLARLLSLRLCKTLSMLPRLIWSKPVPNLNWIFVSRRAQPKVKWSSVITQRARLFLDALKIHQMNSWSIWLVLQTANMWQSAETE